MTERELVALLSRFLPLGAKTFNPASIKARPQEYFALNVNLVTVSITIWSVEKILIASKSKIGQIQTLISSMINGNQNIILNIYKTKPNTSSLWIFPLSFIGALGVAKLTSLVELKRYDREFSLDLKNSGVVI